YRPGNHAEAVLVALGVGVMFTFTVFLLQNGLLQEMMRNAPADMPNVFLINITNRERVGLVELLNKQPGLKGEPGVYASVRAKIVTVDGTPIEQLPLDGWKQRYRRERSVTWHDRQPPQIDVVDGAWWDPASNAAEAGVQLCLADHIAEALNVRPGSVIDWEASGLSIRSTVACVLLVEEVRFGASLDFVFNPGSLDQLPTTYFGGVRVEPEAVGALQRAAYEAYPTITVINAAEVLAIVQEVIDQVALVVRFVSFFAILAGVVILASSVAGTRFRRIREAAILKTLGATRKRVIAIFSLEFLILGGVAGLIGTLPAR
ncbi:MAG: ABC transporter permease, partial [bacterium]|nr:ABC transporter permease [bacterium]